MSRCPCTVIVCSDRGRGPSCPPVPTSSGPDMRQNGVSHIRDVASAWAWEPEPGGPPGPRGVGAGRGGLLLIGHGMCGLVCAVPQTPPSPAACSGCEEGASAEWPVTEPRELYRRVCSEGDRAQRPAQPRCSLSPPGPTRFGPVGGKRERAVWRRLGKALEAVVGSRRFSARR